MNCITAGRDVAVRHCSENITIVVYYTQLEYILTFTGL